MPRPIIAVWGFLAAGLLFLLAATVPLLSGGRMRPSFFVLAMAFLVLGAAIARKNRLS